MTGTGLGGEWIGPVAVPQPPSEGLHEELEHYSIMNHRILQSIPQRWSTAGREPERERERRQRSVRRCHQSPQSQAAKSKQDAKETVESLTKAIRFLASATDMT